MTRAEADEALRRHAFMMAEAIEYFIELGGRSDNWMVLRLWQKIKPSLEALRKEESDGRK